MRIRLLKAVWWLPMIALLLVTTGVYAAEHPTTEHPTGPEHPAGRVPAQAVTLNQVAAAITEYIKTDTKLKGGYFLVWDAKQRKPLALTLVRVHKDKLAKVAEGTYFACSDLRATDRTIYDLDFFLRQTPMGLQVSEISIHKQAGKPRYSWTQQGGLWKRRPM